MRPILATWDEYARTMTPAADEMSLESLRDHAEEMLRAIALDIETPQTESERHGKSLGESDDADATSAASVHGGVRHDSQFTLVQLNGEFRALRASVLQLWLEHAPGDSKTVLAEVMRFNEALDQALAESIATFAERSEYARNMFDAILGHDLRGPLSSIAIAGQLLTRNELRADRAKEVGQRITAAARYMTALVNDLLEFARSRLGGASLPIKTEMANLVDVCNGALDDARAMHPHCMFVLKLSSETEPEVLIDADRVHQLLVNLLGNAGQHGASGRAIRLNVGGNQEEVVLSVVNEGEQIPREDLKRIFDPMVRLKKDLDTTHSVSEASDLDYISPGRLPRHTAAQSPRKVMSATLHSPCTFREQANRQAFCRQWRDLTATAGCDADTC